MAGKLSGWLAYTFSVSRKKMNSIFDVHLKKNIIQIGIERMLLVPLEIISLIKNGR